jgi:hypothetical protein
VKEYLRVKLNDVQYKLKWSELEESNVFEGDKTSI